MKHHKLLKMNYLNLLFLFLSIASITAQHQEVTQGAIDRKFTIEALKSDLNILKGELENKHPGLYSYTSKVELDSTFKKIERSIFEELTAIGFYRKIAVLNSEIKDVHTKIIAPESFIKARDHSLPRFPFAVHLEGSRIYVLRNLSNDELIKPGWEILKINNQKIADLIPEILSRISRDAYNETGPFYKLTTYFSSYYATIKGCPDFFDIEFKGLQNNNRNVKIEALVDKEILSNKNKRYREPIQVSKPISFRISEDVGILKILTFGGGTIKEAGQSYKKEFRRIFNELKNRHIKKLIIDVRDNRGGWPEVGNELCSYLVSSTFTQVRSDISLIDEIANKNYYLKDDYIKHFERLKFKKNNLGFDVIWKDEQVNPQKDVFKGSILVLTNGASASQTGTFAGILKDKTNALFIGEETGGNPNEICGGDIITLILPNTGIMVEIPLRKIISDIEFKSKGRGVVPDYPIKRSLQEKLTHKDVVMEFAMTLK